MLLIMFQTIPKYLSHGFSYAFLPPTLRDPNYSTTMYRRDSFNVFFIEIYAVDTRQVEIGG